MSKKYQLTQKGSDCHSDLMYDFFMVSEKLISLFICIPHFDSEDIDASLSGIGIILKEVAKSVDKCRNHIDEAFIHLDKIIELRNREESD